jgi:NAD(P) transhydrogenase subunit alpha
MPQEIEVTMMSELIAAGYEIAIELGAGDAAGYHDEEYRHAGAAVQADPASLLAAADLVLKVTAPAASPSLRNEIGWMRPGTIYHTEELRYSSRQ